MSIVLDEVGIRAGEFHLESLSLHVESGSYAGWAIKPGTASTKRAKMPLANVSL